VAHNIPYIANRTHLFAIQEGAKPKVPPKKEAAQDADAAKQDGDKTEAAKEAHS